MKAVLLCATSLVFAAQVNNASAQNYNPKPGWKDSYAVGGKCYCDSNGFDHNLDTKTAQTPQGRKNVVEICGDIERVLGKGPTQGRVPYNDIQCGNGPANDAPDEAGCPGRVDIGPQGCNQIGPKWDLASVYGGSNPPPPPPPTGALSRQGWNLSASSRANEAAAAIDGNASSRWATGTAQKSGQFFQIDMGKLNTFDRILLDPAGHPNDYPRSYRVLVSNDGQSWRGPVASAQGNGAVTDIRFADQRARFVRIEQNGSADSWWWSIGEVNLYFSGPDTDASGALSPAGWAIFASSDPLHTADSMDRKAQSRWATRTPQQPGQFFQIDMQKQQRFDKIVLNSQDNPFDYPRAYQVLVSNDGVKWSAPIASGTGNSAVTSISFPARDARYIRIEQTGSDSTHWWSIHEFSVHSVAN